MEILFAYNVFALIFTALALLVIWGGGYAATSAYVSEAKERREVGAGFDAHAWRKYRLGGLVLSIIVLGWSAWCVSDNYAHRAASRLRELALVDFTEAVKQAAARPFDQRCAFNGHKVAEDWIASDTFPCADFGGLRLWRNSQIVVSRYNAGEGSKIFVGRQSGQDVDKLATVDLATGHWGVDLWIPWISTNEEMPSLAALAADIRSSLK